MSYPPWRQKEKHYVPPIRRLLDRFVGWFWAIVIIFGLGSAVVFLVMLFLKELKL